MSSNGSIDLDKLSLDELQQLRQREDSRLQALTPRLAQLSQAQARILASKEAVATLDKKCNSNASTENLNVMIPLTESVYVPGTAIADEKLLVELGTGFYCEKDGKETLAYLDRKLEIVQENRDNVTKAMNATRYNLEAIQMTLQGKLLEIRAKQEGMRHRNLVEGNNA